MEDAEYSKIRYSTVRPDWWIVVVCGNLSGGAGGSGG